MKRAICSAVLLSVVSLPALAQSIVPSASFRAACESQLAPASYSVKANPIGAVVPVRMSLEEINEFTQHTQDLSQRIDSGYTDAKRKYGITYEQSYLYDPENKMFCSTAQAKINVGYTPVKLAIVDALPLNSCSYEMIKEHEFHHVSIFRNFIEKLPESLSRTLNNNPKSEIVYASSLDAANADHFHRMKEIDPIIMASFDPVYRSQHEFDSPGEYQRVLKECNGEFASIMRQEYYKHVRMSTSK